MAATLVGGHQAMLVGHVRVGCQRHTSALVQCKAGAQHLLVHRLAQQFGHHGQAHQQGVGQRF